MKCEFRDGREAEGVWTITSPEALTAVVALCHAHRAEIEVFHNLGVLPPRERPGAINAVHPGGPPRHEFTVSD